MSLGNTFENELLAHIFTNADVANVGDSTGLRGSSAAGSLHLALHTGDPGESGDQTTNEVAYTGYARVAIARSGAGFTVSGNQVVNAADAAFGQRSDAGGAVVATWWSIGTASSGAGKIIARGPLADIATRLAFTSKADDTLTVPGHALQVDHRVVLFPAPGAALPTGAAENTLYWVKTVSGNDITLSATQGGATVDLTTVGAGFIARVRALSITELITPRILAGQLKLQID